VGSQGLARHGHGLRRQTVGPLAGGNGVRAPRWFSRRDLKVHSIDPILLFDLLLSVGNSKMRLTDSTTSSSLQIPFSAARRPAIPAGSGDFSSRRTLPRSCAARRRPWKRREASAPPVRTRTSRRCSCSTSAARSASAGQLGAGPAGCHGGTKIPGRRSKGADVGSQGRGRHSHGLRRQTVGPLAGGSGVRALRLFSRRDLQVQTIDPILLFDLLLSVTAR